MDHGSNIVAQMEGIFVKVFKLEYKTYPTPKYTRWEKKHTEFIHVNYEFNSIRWQEKVAIKRLLDTETAHDLRLTESNIYEEVNHILKENVDIEGCQHPRETCNISVWLSDEAIDEIEEALKDTYEDWTNAPVWIVPFDTHH